MHCGWSGMVRCIVYVEEPSRHRQDCLAMAPASSCSFVAIQLGYLLGAGCIYKASAQPHCAANAPSTCIGLCYSRGRQHTACSEANYVETIGRCNCVIASIYFLPAPDAAGLTLPRVGGLVWVHRITCLDLPPRRCFGPAAQQASLLSTLKTTFCVLAAHSTSNVGKSYQLSMKVLRLKRRKQAHYSCCVQVM